jgi:prepilin-type N-terminal cleavage/methylation domain-containing protein
MSEIHTRRRRRLSRQAGMTLLEIMIVLAILALVMGLLLGPRILRAFQESKEDVQRSLVKKYVSEGYVDWARHHPTKACPGSLQEVADEMGRNDIKDAWGRDFQMGCGQNLPAGAAKDGFAVWSQGADPNDPKDDIKSWE